MPKGDKLETIRLEAVMTRKRPQDCGAGGNGFWVEIDAETGQETITEYKYEDKVVIPIQEYTDKGEKIAPVAETKEQAEAEKPVIELKTKRVIDTKLPTLLS